MFDMIKDKLIAAGVAFCLPTPVWMTRDGKKLEEHEKEQAYGYKVTLEITHPEMVILANEVGCNTSQKGDGHIGGETYMCAKGRTPQKKQQKSQALYLAWTHLIDR